MTANMIDYLLWRGDLPLRDYPFNEVDCAILASISYLPFERIDLAQVHAPLSLGEASRLLLGLPDIGRAVLLPDDVRFLQILAECPRFKDARLVAFANKIDTASQTQFSAVTIDLGSEALYVAFRGTDETLIGWKEDFNMGVVCPVPSQTLAVDYLNETGGSRPLIVCGHSKGGNLAIYASAFCREDVQARIRTIYNFDGPGFTEQVLSTEGYARIKPRIQTFLPQFSVVGMLFSNEGKCTIVHSEQVGIMQHDLFSWDVEKDRFCYLETINRSSRFIDCTLAAWIDQMDHEQREQFVEGIYTVLKQTNARTTKELGDNWFTTVRRALRSLKNLDEPTRRAVIQTLLLLVKSAREGFNQVVQKPGEPPAGE